MEMLLIFHSFFLCRSFILQKLVRFTLFIHCSFLGRERFIFVLSELLFSFFSFFEKKITFLQSVAALVYRCHLTTQARKKTTNTKHCGKHRCVRVQSRSRPQNKKRVVTKCS